MKRWDDRKASIGIYKLFVDDCTSEYLTLYQKETPQGFKFTFSSYFGSSAYSGEPLAADTLDAAKTAAEAWLACRLQQCIEGYERDITRYRGILLELSNTWHYKAEYAEKQQGK